jgi:biotin operon repressor
MYGECKEVSAMNHIRIPVELFKRPFKGVYEMSIFALAYNFKGDGLRQSNDQLAKTLSTSSRTVERAIARLRKRGLVTNKDDRKNHRCLIVSADIMAAVSTGITPGKDTGLKPVNTDSMSGVLPTSGVANTDMTADHKERKNKERREEGKIFSVSAFVAYWNSKGTLPCVRGFTSQRSEKLHLRMGDSLFTDNWREIIDKLSASSFATGQNDRNWKADIDWLLKNSNNYAKVLEGRYDNRGQDIKTVANGPTPFTPEQEQAFLDKHTYLPTESEADELMKKVGLA